MEENWNMLVDVHDLFPVLSFWRQGQAAHSCMETGKCAPVWLWKCVFPARCHVILAQDQWWWEQHIWRGRRERTSTWAFVAETHSPALQGHGKCWFLVLPV